MFISKSSSIKVHAVHPITAVQLEWSLWTRDTEEEIIPTCRELGIGIVAFSPLESGFLASGAKLVQKLKENDFRKSLHRLQPENIEHNKKVYERVDEIAGRKGCTASQLVLAWVQQQGDDVCPIPGTTKLHNFNQNVASLSLKLSSEEMAELECIASGDTVRGDRYSAAVMMATYKYADTPPLHSWKPA